VPASRLCPLVPLLLSTPPALLPDVTPTLHHVPPSLRLLGTPTRFLLSYLLPLTWLYFDLKGS
jgi:hypothetical protein